MATKKNATTVQLIQVDELIKTNDVPAWEGAALKRWAGWAEGKAVSEEDFAEALAQFRTRSCGGGRR